jgi:hypothetical protein
VRPRNGDTGNVRLLCACGSRAEAQLEVYDTSSYWPLFKQSYCLRHCSQARDTAVMKGFDVVIRAAT